MNKIMTLDILSSIKGAKSSKAVDELFNVIKNAVTEDNENKLTVVNTVTLDQLRDDNIIDASEMEKMMIKKNFPVEKNGYLVVSKVIED